MHRYRRLDEARAAAEEAGFAGEMFTIERSVGRDTLRLVMALIDSAAGIVAVAYPGITAEVLCDCRWHLGHLRRLGGAGERVDRR
jgi:hypothetical protein